jgi:Gluconate 2-dehydrogenase subunit 3
MNEWESARRRFLQRATLAATGLVSAAAVERSMSQDNSEPLAPSTVVSPVQQRLIAALSETILPETDTPGARTAEVPEFITRTVSDWFTAEERSAFLQGLDAFESACVAATGTSFSNLTSKLRLAYLHPLDREANAARLQLIDPLPFFAWMKQLTLIGYYTSEIGYRSIGYVGPIGARLGRDGPISSAIWN